MNLTSQQIVVLVASISFRDVQPLEDAAFIGVRGDGRRGADVANTRFAGPVGLYFYDGSHTAEHQGIGLELVVPFLSPNAVILVDDTNWPDARNATLEFLRGNADAFELVVDQPTAGNGHPTFGMV